MGSLFEVELRPESVDRFSSIVGRDVIETAQQAAARLRDEAPDRIVWNVNSTAVGGGVAEMLRPLLSYARGLGVDARWVVIGGTPEFFRITKRLHNALHGELGDGSPLGDAERRVYEAKIHENAQDLLALVRPGDAVILHDPQTAGLVHALRSAGAMVIWRCHIGADECNEQTALGWRFLEPYVTAADVCVFSRAGYAPNVVDPERVVIIQPWIDPFSAKNQDLGADAVRGILVHVGVITGEPGPTSFVRADGSPGRVDRCADIVSLGPPPRADTPLVVQVSRWDDLKDPIGVMHGFCELGPASCGAHLLLVGPNVHAVADDPDGARVFDEVVTAFRALPHHARSTVHLACLPTHDVEENAAIVNAIQRHAAVVVQKSLREGFGLTVTEAMWKARPIVASAVGGIVDQIEDGVHGLLLRDPRDVRELARALERLLCDRPFAESLGAAARRRALERFVGLRSLLEYSALIERGRAPDPPRRAAGADQ